MPAGAVFPYDFGFIPNTRGEDGDALDVLVLMDEPAFSGCLVMVRLLGVIEAEQTETNGKVERNDRLIGVAGKARTHAHIEALSDLLPGMLDEVEAFFGQYNQLAGREFRRLRRSPAPVALALVREGARSFG